MYQALDLKKCLGWFAPVMGAVTLIVFLIRQPQEVFEYFSVVSIGAFVSVFIVWWLGNSLVFHAIWRIKLMQKLLFPYVHGRYEGKISSNWSLIEKQRHAAKGSGQMSEADLSVDSAGTLQKDVTVEITATLFRITMKLIPKDGYSDSQTVCLRPVREGDNGYPRLFYIYRTHVQIPKATDTALHFGAAYVDVIEDEKGRILRGVYWTERGWAKGLNTAGALNVAKVD